METINHNESSEFQDNQLKLHQKTECSAHVEQQPTNQLCSSVSPTINQEKHESDRPKITFAETDKVREIRRRTLSNWLHAYPSQDMMAKGGWFYCNVSDRVICIYCNTICHQWTQNDDPSEVHQRLAPRCPFVSSLVREERTYAVVNDSMKEKFNPHHPGMAEVSRRHATFANRQWDSQCPSIDDLVRAGFFYANVGNVVTCFYCNGSLHKWGANDNPMIEHARWFPSCLYAKHLCGDELHGKIQISKKQLLKKNKTDENQIARLVVARLDLPETRLLLKRFPQNVVRRCIEDQFRLNNDDFASNADMMMACVILKKQIDIIQGCAENIKVPHSRNPHENQRQTAKRPADECSICLTEEKQIACMPCGHLCACVPCGYSMKTCPICREKISSFFRVSL